MRRFAYLVVLGLVVSACGGTATDEAYGLRTVAPEEARAVIDGADGVVVLDIRTPEEFAEGHVEGAVNIDFYAPDFSDQLAELDATDSYVVYCRSGSRSGQAMPMFEDLGFVDVTEVEGGVVAWGDAGLPLVR